jgi:hypothetical protein
MFSSRCSLVFAALTAAALLSPRSSPAADPELATVQGTVTLDGKPLADGKIIFHLADGQFVGARLKADGTYKVERVPVGTCKVTLEAMAKGKNLLPLKYASEETSGLQVEVKKGANVCNFELASR